MTPEPPNATREAFEAWLAGNRAIPWRNADGTTMNGVVAGVARAAWFAAYEHARAVLAQRDALICNLTDALKKVRPLIEDERDVRLDNFTIGNDRATLSELSDRVATMVDDCDNTLRIIDAALFAASGERG